MPVYDFRCPECGERFSVRTSIDERNQVRCPACSSKPEQVFTALNFNKGASQAECSTCTQAGCKWAGRQ
ncbi:MAG TPA: zinc ribbon domain-containing protein [Firmicutes bacterium]|nr:zinc ribbon domain-containing protein [Bacillota bacterium]